MSIEEIIEKKELTVEEMCYVVEKYIEKRKGAKITIDIMSGIVFAPQLVHQVQLLHQAYEHACLYFKK